MAVKVFYKTLLFIFCILLALKAYAEDYTAYLTPSFFIKPFKFNDGTFAPDLDDILRKNFPKGCKFEEIKDDGADYTIAIESINVDAEKMIEDDTLIEVSLIISLKYGVTGSVVKDKTFKSSVLKSNQNEQEFVYNLIKDMIISSSSSIFNIVCRSHQAK
ncbi:MAG: hypothetical protein AB7U85_10135 [Alphaproteobacteria bacterium]